MHRLSTCVLVPGKHFTKLACLPKTAFSVSKQSSLTRINWTSKNNNQLNQTPLNSLNLSKLIVSVKRRGCNVHTPVFTSPLIRNLQTAKPDNNKDIETTNGNQPINVAPNNTTQSKYMTPLELLEAYASLGKLKLSALVIVTTMVGYFMAPTPFIVGPFVWSSLGTSLAIVSANTFNQMVEVDKDAQMSRTLTRILPSGKISMAHAGAFGVATGVAGTAMLASMVNPLTAVLAFSNIFLYAGVYTPLKQKHPINTWVGSVVGAIPPMIGWAAATGGLGLGAWTLGTLLYIWQIPHFLALAWSLRADYEKAGYKMLSNVAPEKLPAATLRWSLYLLPIGLLCCWSNMTSWAFAYDSLIPNFYLLWFAWKFYRDNSNTNARKLFFASILYLPLLLALMMFHKLLTDGSDDDDEDKTKKDEKKEDENLQQANQIEVAPTQS